MSNLLRFNRDYKTLVWDYETTSLNLVSSEIQTPWQLGWILSEGKRVVEQREEWIHWPDLVYKMNTWGKGAAAVTGWTEWEYLKKAKPPEPILESFEKVLFDPTVISVGANSWNFDIYVHNIYRKLLDKKPDWSYLSRHVDIQTLAKAAFLGIVPPPIGTDEWIFFNIKMSNFHQKGLKTNLAHMCREFDIPYDADRHHREAMYDCEITGAIFHKQIQTLHLDNN